MRKRTKLVGDEAFEDLASAYQVVLVSMLDQVLRDSGIAVKRKRRQICERFLQVHGVLHDQCWLRSGGRTVYPLLGFAEVFQNVGMTHEQLGAVVVDKEKFFSFNESVWSVLRCYFEPDETVPPVEAGLVGQESGSREGPDGDHEEAAARDRKRGRRKTKKPKASRSRRGT